jgi:hypothetical protein
MKVILKSADKGLKSKRIRCAMQLKQQQLNNNVREGTERLELLLKVRPVTQHTSLGLVDCSIPLDLRQEMIELRQGGGAMKLKTSLKWRSGAGVEQASQQPDVAHR